MAAENLKPCPFCGGKAYIRKPMPHGAFDIMSIECRKCGASPFAIEVYADDTFENKQNAIAEIWNRRANE